MATLKYEQMKAVIKAAKIRWLTVRPNEMHTSTNRTQHTHMYTNTKFKPKAWCGRCCHVPLAVSGSVAVSSAFICAVHSLLFTLQIEECTDILVNYRAHGFPLSSTAAERPSPSGSVFLYNANTASEWYEDGYMSVATFFKPKFCMQPETINPVSYTHLRAHETDQYL
eukprot:905793-Amorphochlora_amoeboformis.AAC.1